MSYNKLPLYTYISTVKLFLILFLIAIYVLWWLYVTPSSAQFLGNTCIDTSLRLNSLPGIEPIALWNLNLDVNQNILSTTITGVENRLETEFCAEYHLLWAVYPIGQSITQANKLDNDIDFRMRTQYSTCSISTYLQPNTLTPRIDALVQDSYVASVSSELVSGDLTDLASYFGASPQNTLPQRFVISRDGEMVSGLWVAPSWSDDALPQEFEHLCRELNCNGSNLLELDVDGDGLQNNDNNELDIDNDWRLDSEHSIELDTDGDGISNEVDIDIDCDWLYNREDDDMDGDGIDNKQDDDMDGDGEENEWDSDCNCNGRDDSDEDDADGDWIPDDVDPDFWPSTTAWSTTAWSTTAWSTTAWSTTAWSATAWSTTAWSTTAWSTTAWSTTAWSTTAWSTTAWSTTAWSTTAWSTTAWSTTAWSTTAWSTTAWSSSTWSSSTWSSSTWSSSTWSTTAWSSSTWSTTASTPDRKIQPEDSSTNPDPSSPEEQTELNDKKWFLTVEVPYDPWFDDIVIDKDIIRPSSAEDSFIKLVQLINLYLRVVIWWVLFAMLIYWWFVMMISRWDPAEFKKWLKILLYAVIWLWIALFSYVIIRIVVNLFA